ncbi:MAG: hypothetical protein JXR84_04230 [Anaerolineae bacterium]|nr:hypothetical protein [Anaerolineae bacterium]
MDSGWLTDQAIRTLAAIVDAEGRLDTRNAQSRRHTVQRVAWAIEVECMTDDQFFAREKALHEGARDVLLTARSTWWKVRGLADIAAALEACKAAAREWHDGEVQRSQIEAQRKVMLALASNAETAIVGGLTAIIADKEVRGDHRLQGIDRYVQLFSPDLARQIPTGARSGEDGEQTLRIELGSIDPALAEAVQRKDEEK